FFQAEDGIRDKLVTGVQTCALPIWFSVSWQLLRTNDEKFTYLVPKLLGFAAAIVSRSLQRGVSLLEDRKSIRHQAVRQVRGKVEIGRASCREIGQNETARERGHVPW